MRLQIGDTLPPFTLPDQEGRPINIFDLSGDKYLVVFFYPKDHTPVCTTEACTFQTHDDEFKGLHAEVVGISADSVASHRAFAARHGLTFTLLSDPKKAVEKLFGIKRNLWGLLPERITFVFNPQRTLIHSFQSQLNGKKHTQEALAAIKKAQAQ